MAVLCWCSAMAPLAAENYSTWTYSAKLRINTSATGANVHKIVPDFPMLVRIADPRILSQSMSSGADLRFSDRDGRPLDFQIERWAPGSGKAEVWVRVPVVDSNSDNQWINVHWGKPGSPWVSDGAKVYLRSSAYWMVYHLGEGGTQDRANSVGNWNHAKPVNYDGDERVEGLIGMADSLDGANKGDYLDLGAGFDTLTQFSFNLWAFHAKPSNWERFLDLGNGDSNDNLVFARIDLTDSLTALGYGSLTFLNRVTTVSDLGRVSAGKAIEARKWAFYGVTVMGNAVTLYKNGIPIAAGNWTKPLSVNKRLTNYIGHSNWPDGDQDFSGIMDQAELASGFHSSDWMKLTYESQRPDAKMFAWEFPSEIKLAITAHPSGLTVKEGNPFSLTVAATALGDPAFQWLKDGVPIPDAVGGSLNITAATLADAGLYSCRVTDGKDTLVSNSAAVSVPEVLSTWAHSKKVFINSVAAGLVGDVANIPILVRLGKGALDFREAAEGGKDLRFADADGTPLAHAIEEWGVDTALAWVRVPKVAAGNDQGYITMYWGKGAARNGSSPGYVFSLNDNWRIYYDFADAPVGGGDVQTEDGTMNGFQGQGAGVASLADGPIGKCFRFAGAGHVAAPQGAIEGLRTFTAMAWVRQQAGAGGAIGFEFPQIFGTWELQAGQGEFGAFSDKGALGMWNGMNPTTQWSTHTTSTRLDDGKWHAVALTFTGSVLTLYADGKTLVSVPGENVPLPPNVLSIGAVRNASGAWVGPLRGDIDAVQVTGDAKSPDWIRLAAAVQKPGSTILSFGAPSDLAPAPPAIDPAGGDFDAAVAVRLLNAADGARLFYTLDGSDPDTAARGSTRLYEGSITLPASATVKAMAYRAGRVSVLASASFRIAFISASGDTLKPGGTKAVDPIRRISYPNQDSKIAVLLTLEPPWDPKPAGFDRIGPLFRLSSADPTGVFPGLDLDGDSLAGLSLFRREDHGAILWMPPKDGQLWIPAAGAYFWGRDIQPPKVRLAGTASRGSDSLIARIVVEDNVSALQGMIRYWQDGPDSLGWWSTLSGDVMEFIVPVPSDPAMPMEVRFAATDQTSQAEFPRVSTLTLPRPLPSIAAGFDLKGGYHWKMAGMPLSSLHLSLRELAVRSGTGPLVAAEWRNQAPPDTGYRILREDDTLPSGKGFWIAASGDAPSLNFPAATAVASDTDGLFPIALHQGWNLVTCPSLRPVAWPVSVSDGEAYLRSPLKPLYAFAESGYSRPDSLRPWESYFVFYSKDTAVHVGPGAPRVKEALPKAKSAGPAGLRLSLTANGGISLALGAAPSARAGLGVEDEGQPPSLEARSSAWLSRSGRALAVDYVAWDPSAAMSWTVKTRGQPQGSSLAVSAAALPEGVEAWAVSGSRRLKWRLLPGGILPVTGDDTLAVYAGTPSVLAAIPELRRGREAAGAFAATLRAVGGGLELILDLPSDARLDARLVSPRGQLVAALSDRPLSPGRHALGWRTLGGRGPLLQGIYWLDLRVRGLGWIRHQVHSATLIR
ncbi:MAG: DUF2341 domain-containing protein [Fibrobacteria bacterium]